MIRNYLKIAFRNILKNKTSTIINIFGLSVGLASVILILLFVRNELIFDNHLENKDRIYRVTLSQSHPGGTDYNCETPFPLAPLLNENFPEIKYVSRIYCDTRSLIHMGETKFLENNVVFVDDKFLNIFNFSWISGSPESSLNDANSVVLTESLALKYFNSTAAYGEIIKLGNLFDLKVTGVIKDTPATTHLPVSMILSLETLTPEYIGANYDKWDLLLGGFFTYVLLPEKTDTKNLEKGMNEFLKRHAASEKSEVQDFELQPLKDIHYDARYSTLNYITSKRTLWIFTIIGIFILLIACINYINLSLVKSFKRSREIGIRKVIGAERKELVFQFLIESLIISIITVILAFSLSEIFTPELNSYLGNGVHLNLYTGPVILLIFAVIAIALGLLTGLYPAIIVSGFLPLKAIKNKITSHSPGVRFLKNGLIIFQFIITQVLIINLFIISSQLKYISKKDMGFDKSSIVNIAVPDVEQRQILKDKILQIPGVTNMTFGIAGPCASLDERFTSFFYSKETDNPIKIDCEMKGVDEDYMKTFNLKLLAGEWLTEHKKGDSVRKVVVNETLIKKLGYLSAEEALGARLNFGRIAGVIKDFHMESLHNVITPMIMIYYPRFYGQAYIKFAGEIPEKSIQKTETIWGGIFPNDIFSHKIYDNHLSELYSKEEKALQLIWFFSVVAIIIACLGLFALLSYILIQKTNEIGIRKVFGAPVSKIVMYLSSSYLILILISNIIAWPIAWYFAQRWLDSFVYRIDMNPIPFILALVISMAIVFTTLFYHTLKTARTNPVDALKYE